MEHIFPIVVRGMIPSLLPILRSQQQAVLLARLLGNPDAELSLSELATSLEMPVSSVHREVERAEATGLLTSHKIGNTRLVRANTASPYFAGLADVLVRAFGPPQVIAEALASVDGIDSAYIYGSWAARFAGTTGQRPVNDIDLLVLGSPDRDDLYAAIASVEARLGRLIQITVRAADWLTRGSGSFHATVTERPLVQIYGSNNGNAPLRTTSAAIR